MASTVETIEQVALRRQQLTATTFVEIVDTLVDNFDVIEVLTVLTSRTVELLSATAAGILLADEHGQLRVMAASTEQIQLLELFQLQNDEGPCLDSFRSGAVVADADLTGRIAVAAVRGARASAAGYPSVCAIPMRLKDRVLGCLNLFMSTPQRAASDRRRARSGPGRRGEHRRRAGSGGTRLAAIREGHLPARARRVGSRSNRPRA